MATTSGVSTVNSTLRNTLGIIVGVIIGGIVNGGFVVIGPMIIPPPGGFYL